MKMYPEDVRIDPAGIRQPDSQAQGFLEFFFSSS